MRDQAGRSSGVEVNKDPSETCRPDLKDHNLSVHTQNAVSRNIM